MTVTINIEENENVLNFKNFEDFLKFNTDNFEPLSETNLPPHDIYVLCKRKSGAVCFGKRKNSPLITSDHPSNNCYWDGFYLKEATNLKRGNTISFSDVTVDGWQYFDMQSFYMKSMLMKKVLLWLSGEFISNHCDEDEDADYVELTDVGNSSRTMAFNSCGIKGMYDHPHDAGDLSRCMKLVNYIPEIKLYFKVISQLSSTWEIIINNWDYLEEKYEQFKSKQISYSEFDDEFIHIKGF